MSATFDAVFSSWPFDPWLVAGLLTSAAVYVRGWRRLRVRDTRRWHVYQPAFFLCGLFAIYGALASPIEPFSLFFLQVHMAQHLLLMMVAPPLLWLGAPFFPMLRGLPAEFRSFWLYPILRSRFLQRIFAFITHPIPAWLVYVGATWVWHLPRLYELAIRSDNWHYVQHVCFLIAGLVFWYPVVRPYPSRPSWSRWWLFPYLILADVQNTVLSALLTFSDRVIYQHYSEVPRLGSMSALEDQAAAGVMMWVPGSVAFLGPLFLIGITSLGAKRAGSKPNRQVTVGRVSLPLVAARTSQRDLLATRGFGRVFHWRHARLFVQLPMLALAGLLIYDGLFGTQVTPLNLAGVLPWIHWRGLLIISLLIVGNVFCFACPFMVPRAIARKLIAPPLVWPRALRNKWLAVALVAGFLWAYEVFALWDSPWWTAWLAIGYFVGVLVIDSIFRGAAFCKYVCPIGQFNYVQSLIAPWEIRVKNQSVCDSCRTKDCIRGGATARGCELNLFVPRKSSNMDCTLCLDCVHACPHDNVGLLSTTPASALWHDRLRSGIGRFSNRPDIAALTLVLVFGAFANAGGMVAPVVEYQESLRAYFEGASPFWISSGFYLLSLLVIPAICVTLASAISRWAGSLTTSRLEIACRFALTLAPLGFAMWLSHYSFHFVTSVEAIVPANQRFLADHGIEWSSGIDAANCCCRATPAWLIRLEILSLDFGLLLSAYSGYRVALSETNDCRRAIAMLLPWAVIMIGLFAIGVWILLQPMQMRGTMQLVG